jgi:hypothetical protein
MIDFPFAELLDDGICLIWLERPLHLDGLKCRHCGSTARWLFRHQEHFPTYRCRIRDGYYTLLTGTVFEKTRQHPATLALLLRSIGTAEPTPTSSRARSATQATAYLAPMGAGEPEPHRADSADDRHDV